jgi:hypothetical protein
MPDLPVGLPLRPCSMLQRYSQVNQLQIMFVRAEHDPCSRQTIAGGGYTSGRCPENAGLILKYFLVNQAIQTFESIQPPFCCRSAQAELICHLFRCCYPVSVNPADHLKIPLCQSDALLFLLWFICRVATLSHLHFSSLVLLPRKM